MNKSNIPILLKQQFYSELYSVWKIGDKIIEISQGQNGRYIMYELSPEELEKWEDYDHFSGGISDTCATVGEIAKLLQGEEWGSHLEAPEETPGPGPEVIPERECTAQDIHPSLMFDLLAVEVYHGFNMKLILNDIKNKEPEVYKIIYDFVRDCKEARQTIEKRQGDLSIRKQNS